MEITEEHLQRVFDEIEERAIKSCKNGIEYEIVISTAWIMRTRLLAILMSKSEEEGDVKMEKTEKIDEFIKPEKGQNFIHVCNDPLFFERECNMRHYVICVSCGFIPLSMIDRDTKFLDLHCKCGKFAIYSSFPEEEILTIIHNTKESMKFESM